MSEQNIRIFINGINHYFNQIGISNAIIGTPYLSAQSADIVNDFTGIIGISGTYKGCVYFTAPRALINHILLTLGETDIGVDNCCDLVGEIANTISGNARMEFGSDFMISVPVVLQGMPEKIRLPTEIRSFVIPVNWKNYEASLIIGLQK